jgi:hypothetical protein
MGLEASCRVTFVPTGVRKSQRAEGLAHLDDKEITFKGDVRLRIPFTAIREFDAKAGALRVTFTEGVATFDLGPQAEKWALKIRYPKGRLDKLGVKPTSVVSVIGVDDPSFHEELHGRAASISIGRAKKASDLIVFGATATSALDKLTALRASIVPAGAIWVVWPKGQKALREDDVRKAAVAQGLVDVKVMSFSDALSGLKLVIPKHLRAV